MSHSKKSMALRSTPTGSKLLHVTLKVILYCSFIVTLHQLSGFVECYVLTFAYVWVGLQHQILVGTEQFTSAACGDIKLQWPVRKRILAARTWSFLHHRFPKEQISYCQLKNTLQKINSLSTCMLEPPWHAPCTPWLACLLDASTLVTLHLLVMLGV